jgi:hypothetical protein
MSELGATDTVDIELFAPLLVHGCCGQSYFIVVV